MGSPLDTAFTVVGTLEPPNATTIDSVFAQVFVNSTHNLDLRIADLNLQRSLFDMDIARTERFPVISLSGDAGYLSSGDNLRLPPDQRVNGWGYSVGVTVENLLFGWGVTDLRIQQAQLNAETIRLNYELQRRGLVADVARLRSQVASNMDQLHSINSTLTIANDNYTLTKAQYAGGGATALDVLSAEQLLSENRSMELQTRADLHRLLARARQLSEH
jgi:outer membrane protein TolC